MVFYVVEKRDSEGVQQFILKGSELFEDESTIVNLMIREFLKDFWGNVHEITYDDQFSFCIEYSYEPESDYYYEYSIKKFETEEKARSDISSWWPCIIYDLDKPEEYEGLAGKDVYFKLRFYDLNGSGEIIFKADSKDQVFNTIEQKYKAYVGCEYTKRFENAHWLELRSEKWDVDYQLLETYNSLWHTKHMHHGTNIHFDMIFYDLTTEKGLKKYLR